MKNIVKQQKIICKKYHATFYCCDLSLKSGVSLSVKEGAQPIKGLRLMDSHGTNGWYIFAGEYSNDANFYLPLCAIHLKDWAPNVLPYLGLPPGWGFVIDNNGYEDVWEAGLENIIQDS